GRIGENIPPIRYMTIDLKFTPLCYRDHNQRFLQLVAKMAKPPKGKGEPVTVDNPQSEGGHRDWGLIRLLSLLSFSPQLERFVSRVGVEKTVVSKVSRYLTRADGGFAAYWHYSTREPSDTVPLTRFAQAKYLLSESPKLRYIFRILQEQGMFDALRDGRRLPRFLIFCQNPLTTWVVSMLLESLGVPTLAIRSTTTTEARAAIARKFCERDARVGALVTTYACGAYGLNLHSQSSRVICVESPQNLAGIWQGGGRVHRVGQAEPQRVWILFLDHTIQRWLEWNNMQKALPEVAGVLYGALRGLLATGTPPGGNDDDESVDGE
ncbi:C-terminal helicase domain-containing protein, partial [Aspergillus neoniger CBS 115656]